jgi:hypothetical protein
MSAEEDELRLYCNCTATVLVQYLEYYVTQHLVKGMELREPAREEGGGGIR